jgi:hypothetical protein
MWPTRTTGERILSKTEENIIMGVVGDPDDIYRLRTIEEHVLIPHISHLVLVVRNALLSMEGNSEEISKYERAAAAAIIWAVANINSVPEETKEQLKLISRQLDSFIRPDLVKKTDDSQR